MTISQEQVADQAHKYSRSIGTGFSSEQIADILEFSSDATRRQYFIRRENLPFWYERYDKAGLTEKVSDLADTWVQNEANIKRAATQVERPLKPAGKELVHAFGVYRFKEYTKEGWELVKSPARASGSMNEVQTMVCVALENIGPSNGFPWELQRGQDVCIDSQDTLLLPPTGGGLVILIWIKV